MFWGQVTLDQILSKRSSIDQATFKLENKNLEYILGNFDVVDLMVFFKAGKGCSSSIPRKDTQAKKCLLKNSNKLKALNGGFCTKPIQSRPRKNEEFDLKKTVEMDDYVNSPTIINSPISRCLYLWLLRKISAAANSDFKQLGNFN